MVFPECPPEIKSMAHVLKVAEDHEERNIVVAYWARMYVVNITMKLMSVNRTPAVDKLLFALMDWLEKTKKENLNNEGITSQVVAQSMIENYALQLFARADAMDRDEDFSKNTIKAFYVAGILMDVLEDFGALSEDMKSKRKYAKWKAAYIHACLKDGEDPLPGAPEEYENSVTVDQEARNRWWRKYHTTERQEREYENYIDGENTELGGGAQRPADLLDRINYDDNDEGPDASSGDVPTIGASTPPPTIPPTSTPPPSIPPTSTPPPIVTLPTTPSISDNNPSIDSASLSQTEKNLKNIQEAQKFCKFATSALNYDDTQTAIENLQKALELLKSTQN